MLNVVLFSLFIIRVVSSANGIQIIIVFVFTFILCISVLFSMFLSSFLTNQVLFVWYHIFQAYDSME